MRLELAERKARQREEGKVAMADYLKNQKETLSRMAELKAQRLAREQPKDTQANDTRAKRARAKGARREQRIDEALEESFPASDPPAFVGH